MDGTRRHEFVQQNVKKRRGHVRRCPSTAPDCSKSSGPCPFDIEQDPCDSVQKLLAKLEEYRNSSGSPRNKHMDPRANPKYHGGAWVPWDDLP